LAEVIGAKVEVGLSAQRIYQDLVQQNVLFSSPSQHKFLAASGF
jgi:hypothetical protein